MPFRGFTLFAEQGYNPIVTYSLTVVNRNITERDETMKYEVWVLEKRLVGENRWRQFFCDNKQEALDIVEGFIDIAEKIEVIAE